MVGIVRTRRLFVLLATALVALVVLTPRAVALDDSSSTEKSQSSVYTVLDSFGPEIFSAKLLDTVSGSSSHVAVFWMNRFPIVFVNGLPVTTTGISYASNSITIDGLVSGGSGRAVHLVLGLDDNQNIVIQISGLEGFGGLRITLGSLGGGDSTTVAVCRCWGGDPLIVVRRVCTNPECDDPGIGCSLNPGAVLAYCQWRATVQVMRDHQILAFYPIYTWNNPAVVLRR